MLIVQKYGGATLATPEKIKSAATRIRDLVKAGHQVVVIVSAMGQTTNQLIELAQKVATEPNLRELDMLLSTGERVSMALVSMALHDLNCPAISFTGSQAGILTNDSHINALITDVKAFRVSDSLRDGKVVVLAGYQGVSPITKEITTLGRGGTDTTAVAMALHLKADHCEILKEVPAVFTADPGVVKSARPLTELCYEHLAHMCFWGAKVLHYRSVELAARNQVPLFVGPAHDMGSGTWIRKSISQNEKGAPMIEGVKILSLNSFEKVLQLSTGCPSAHLGLESFMKVLEGHQVGLPQILQTDCTNKTFSLRGTGPIELLTALDKAFKQESSWKLVSQESAVTATTAGSVAPELFSLVMGRLQQAGVSVGQIQNTNMGLTVYVPTESRKTALECLHQLI